MDKAASIGDNEATPLLQHHDFAFGGLSIWKDFGRRRETASDDVLHSFSWKRNKWYPLLFGQMIALIAASQSSASFTLEYGLQKVFPFFLMSQAYAIMACHLLFTRIPPSESEASFVPMTSIRIRTPCWYYFILSILDVTPNYLTLLSLKHTSLTSSTLLGSLTAPSIMVSCHVLLGKVYQPAHLFGVAICLVGGVLNVYTDLLATSTKTDSSEPIQHLHSIYGDLLSVMAAMLYGLGDALGEFWCKHVDRKEYLGMLGLVGFFFCAFLALFLEQDEIVDLFRDTENLGRSLGVIAVYVPALVLYYVSASVFLVSSDATLLNLSLQSSNLWAILFSVVAFDEAPTPIFYMALTFVVSGVFVYEIYGNEGDSPHMLNDSNGGRRERREVLPIKQ